MVESGHEGHNHDVTLPIDGTKVSRSDAKLSTSYRVSLEIWIRRFKEAQGVIRELEKENEQLTEKLTVALELMSDEQLTELKKRLVEGPKER